MKRYLFILLPLLLLPFAVFAQTASSYVPLTALPGITTITNSGTNFIPLFNSLYKVCIGVAAALALVEIIWAGVTWMTAGDSSEKVSNAKGRIANAILGLVLVLSPVIVFGIINPNVLSLHLDVSSLTPTNVTGGGTTAAGTATGTPAPGTVGSTATCTNGVCPTGCTPNAGATPPTTCTVNGTSQDAYGDPSNGNGGYNCEDGTSGSCVECQSGYTTNSASNCAENGGSV
jgi:hypothetical protein